MSTIDLIVLGCVAKRPASAYDIQKDIEEHNLAEWTRISIPSVYKKVLRLKEQGYLRIEEEHGERTPVKNVYHITEKGTEYLKSLMYECSLQKPRIIMDFNAVICNLNAVDKRTALELIDNIKDKIEEARDYYVEALGEHSDIPLVGRTIMEQQGRVCDTLSEWALDFQKEYKKERRQK